MRRISLSFVLALSLVGCSDNGKTQLDTGTKLDRGTQPDQAVVVPPITCAGDCKDFVMNKLIVPMNQTDAQKYAFTYGGKTYNALGQVLALIGAQVKSLDLQSSIDGAINAGTTVVLLRLQAKSWTDDPAARGQNWIGAKTTCCPDPKDVTGCATEAQKTCFNGTKEFTPDATNPQGTTMSGKIAASALSLNAPSMRLLLPITSAGVLDVGLDSVQLHGTLAVGSPDKITDGVLAGAMSIDDVNNKLIPTIAEMMTKTLQDPNVAQSTKDPIITLFDTNPKDNQITKEELASNGLIATILAGDLDLNGDKKADHLSLGVGFAAVTAVIKN